jgi:hypothetical protein
VRGCGGSVSGMLRLSEGMWWLSGGMWRFSGGMWWLSEGMWWLSGKVHMGLPVCNARSWLPPQSTEVRQE